MIGRLAIWETQGTCSQFEDSGVLLLPTYQSTYLCPECLEAGNFLVGGLIQRWQGQQAGKKGLNLTPGRPMEGWNAIKIHDLTISRYLYKDSGLVKNFPCLAVRPTVSRF